MVSQHDVQHSQRLIEEDQNLGRFKEVVECGHRRKRKRSHKREKKPEFGGCGQGESKQPDVDSAIQPHIVE